MIKTRTKDKSFWNQKNTRSIKDIFKNKIKHNKKKSDLLKNAFVNVKKRKTLSEKGLKKITKMQSLSQNEFSGNAWSVTRWAWTNRKNKKD